MCHICFGSGLNSVIHYTFVCIVVVCFVFCKLSEIFVRRFESMELDFQTMTQCGRSSECISPRL